MTRKVTRWCADYQNKKGHVTPLQIGNVHAIRDWTDARDMVKGIHKMMHLDEPTDFVLGSGVGRTVLELLEIATECVGINMEWNDETGKGIDVNTGQLVIETNPKYYRPLEVNELIANPTKANTMLDWKPEISFEEMIQEMVMEDVV